MTGLRRTLLFIGVVTTAVLLPMTAFSASLKVLGPKGLTRAVGQVASNGVIEIDWKMSENNRRNARQPQEGVGKRQSGAVVLLHQDGIIPSKRVEFSGDSGSSTITAVPAGVWRLQIEGPYTVTRVQVR